jgi:hypothetical protein
MLIIGKHDLYHQKKQMLLVGIVYSQDEAFLMKLYFLKNFPDKQSYFNA